MSAMGSPIATSVPSVTRRCTNVPSVSASISTTALSVSMTATTPPFVNALPTASGHEETIALVAPAATSGMRSNSGMSDSQRLEGGFDFFTAGNSGAFKDLADAR